MKNELSFKFDYLNGIVPITGVDMFFESLKNISDKFDLSNWVRNTYAVRGIRNYNTRYHFMGLNHFIVSWNCSSDDEYIALTPEQSKFNPYIYLTISGSGLLYFSLEEQEKLFSYLYRVGFKCTRLDVACDILNRNNDIVPYVLASFRHGSRDRKPKDVPFVTSNMSLEPKLNNKTGKIYRPVTYTTYYTTDGDIVENMSFGNHSSDLGMFRAYDKYFERGLDVCSHDALHELHRKLYPDNYCFRFEVELHKKHSQALFNLYCSTDMKIYDVFASALISMFTIKVSKGVGYQSQLCDVSPVWTEFLTELSNNIHFVELDKVDVVPALQLPIEQLKERLIHYAPLLCAYEDLCYIDDSFRSRIMTVESLRYENKYQYQYLRQLVFKERERRANMIII